VGACAPEESLVFYCPGPLAVPLRKLGRTQLLFQEFKIPPGVPDVLVVPLPSLEPIQSLICPLFIRWLVCSPLFSLSHLPICFFPSVRHCFSRFAVEHCFLHLDFYQSRFPAWEFLIRATFTPAHLSSIRIPPTGHWHAFFRLISEALPLSYRPRQARNTVPFFESHFTPLASPLNPAFFRYTPPPLWAWRCITPPRVG